MGEAEEDHDAFVSERVKAIAAGGAGATRAFSELYRQLRRRLLSFLLRKGLAPAAAEDALHEIFMRVARSAAQCRHGGTAAAWLWRIAANTAMDVHREATRVVDIDDEQQQAEAENLIQEVVDTPPGAVDLCVSQALQRFARHHPERAEAIRLLHLEQWSGEQLAAYLGRTAGATREFISQCRRVFKPYVQACRELLAA